MSWEVVIISGGQIGADRAALDFALQHGIPHGGWVQKGRKAKPPLQVAHTAAEAEWHVSQNEA